MDYLEFLKEQLTKASKVASDNFGHVSSTIKQHDPNQVLTQTDIEIGKLLVSAVKENYPDHNIIDEETGVINNNSAFTWIIDPIDGTSNFASGVPTYGTMIGLLKDSQPIAGGIALPFFQEIILAEKDKGAFCNGGRLSVTSETGLSKVLIAYGLDSNENINFTQRETDLIAKIVSQIRNLRASNSVFDVVMVAKGNYGGYLNQASKIWDNVAPHIVIEEAGGIYTDFYGNPMDYSNPLEKFSQNFTFCIASPEIHKKLQEIIHPAV